MGKVESFDAVEKSADVATEYLVTDRLQHILIKRKKPGEYLLSGLKLFISILGRQRPDLLCRNRQGYNG